jgi:hypothetical protein
MKVFACCRMWPFLHVVLLLLLTSSLVLVGARGRTSSLNRKPPPVPEPKPEPVEERDIDPSGCQYMGKFRAERGQAGRGQETSDWGKTVYSGEFRDCLYHGEGLKTYADGRVYEGEWAFGKPHGVGKFQFSNGKTVPQAFF